MVEDHGNVVGVITNGDGTVSEFLIRFNPQDGSNNPDPSHVVENQSLSVNNLKSAAPIPVFLGNGPGWARTANSNFECPAGRAIVYVEGRAGDGLRSATVDNPYPDPGNRRVVTRLVECHFKKKNNGNDLTPGAMFAGSQLVAELQDEFVAQGKSGKGDGGFELKTSSRSAPPVVYVNGDVKAVDQLGTNLRNLNTNIKSPLGRVISSGTITAAGNVNTELKPNSGMPNFPVLDWEQLTKGTSAPETLKAGIYMWRDTGGVKKLYYYDESYEHYQSGSWTPPALSPTDMVNSTGLKNSLGSALSTGKLDALDGGQLKIQSSLDVQVSANMYSTLAIVSESNNFGAQGASDQKFTFEPPSKEMLFLSNGQGNIFLEGKIEGNKGASLTSFGNLSLAGGGSDVNAYGVVKDTPVNLYSQGKIFVKTLGGPDKKTGLSKYEDLKLRGLVYSWGDIEFDAGDAKLEVTGAVVAYGTDMKPSLSNYGSAMVNGRGSINLRGKQARINYEDGVISTLKSGAASGPVERCFWASY